MASNHDDSGVVVYPRLPVARRGEPARDERERKGHGKLIALVAAIAGGAAVWFVQPIVAPDRRIAGAEQRADDAEAAARTQKTRADALEKSLDTAAKGRRDAEAQLAIAEVAQRELAGKSTNEAARHKATDAVQAKLKATGAGITAIDGEQVHLQIASAGLFKPGDDALTDHGKAVLAKVAAALKALPDRSVSIQGHTDEALTAPKPAKKPGKTPPPAPRFATTWELSAARALAVLHYFQDTAELEPARLAAVAFGSYAANKAAPRRIELVVAPRKR